MKSFVRVIACIPFALVALLSSPHAVSGQSKADQLDALFTYYNGHGLFNGVVLAAEHGDVVYRRAFGFSDFGEKTPLDTSAVFSIASITKPYTALAVMLLAERGRLSYDDKLVDYLPEFPSYAGTITIRHLLTHTSGLVDYLNDLFLMYRLPEVTTQAAIDSVMSQPGLKFEPGEKYEYSNTGYLLLARIVEKVSGRTYGDFLRREIFEPLGMRRTYVNDGSADSIPGRVKCYRGFWEECDYDLQVKAIGSGCIYSTVNDQCLFDQALYSGELVSLETLSEAVDPERFLGPEGGDYRYGFGWKIDMRHPGRHIVYHNGALAGFRCLLWRSLDEKDTLIILANNTWLSEKPEILDGATAIMAGETFGLGRIPATLRFYEDWYLHGLDAGMQSFREAIADPDSTYEMSEMDVNALGYFLMGRNRLSEAIEIFRLNVELYPEAYNTYDSLGEAYLAAGNEAAGIENYRKALALNPDCETAREALSKPGED